MYKSFYAWNSEKLLFGSFQISYFIFYSFSLSTCFSLRWFSAKGAKWKTHVSAADGFLPHWKCESHRIWRKCGVGIGDRQDGWVLIGAIGIAWGCSGCIGVRWWFELTVGRISPTCGAFVPSGVHGQWSEGKRKLDYMGSICRPWKLARMARVFFIF